METDFDIILQIETDEKWQRFIAASAEVHEIMAADNAILDDLKKTFMFSNFIAANLTRNPGIMADLIKSGDILREDARKDYRRTLTATIAKIDNADSLGAEMRRFRCREMIRIAFRDLSGRADLEATMADLSALAEVCVDIAADKLYRWQTEQDGIPTDADGNAQQLIVIALGKLGAGELNFSSDIDLMFAFPSSGSTCGGRREISNAEFFERLCRKFLNIFSKTSQDGILFRVDLRLRPFGENGPIVMHFNAMEDYYESQGRDWERYALIKARIIAGGAKTGEDLLHRLEPFIYRRYFDYGSFEALRAMKARITAEVNRKGMRANIKTGPGGIREIEFFGQVFQLIRGGIEPELKTPSICAVLDQLVISAHIRKEIREELILAYRFLRNTEHRLQMTDDRQTHMLPAEPLERHRLALSAGFRNWSGFDTRRQHHMQIVHRHFMDILSNADSADDASPPDADPLEGVWQNYLDEQTAADRLKQIGYANPDTVLQLLAYLRAAPETRALSQNGLQRLNRLMPILLERVSASSHPETVLNLLIDLVKTVQRRTCYLSLLLENPETVNHLASLAEGSPWIINFLARHPVLLDELLDTRTLYKPPSRTSLQNEITDRLSKIPVDDLEYVMETLCIFKQVNTLRVAAADISAAYPLMRVSDHLSDIAEIVMQTVLGIAWNYLASRHGLPGGVPSGSAPGAGFAVVSYGKLGGIELGYGSDLDLVFLHAASPGQTQRSANPTENAQFYTRLGQRIIHFLTTRTRAGTLYEIDMRLRPSGAAGPLVSHIDAFMEYQENQAWTWEHQALVRARAICGDPLLIKRFQLIRQEILCQKRDAAKLRNDIKIMRKRMRENSALPADNAFDLKQSPGGIVDIEFLVQYLVLLHANKYPALTDWSDVVRILETLASLDIMTSETALLLKTAFLYYRSAVHKSNLQKRAAQIPAGKTEGYPEKVLEVWRAHLSS